MSVRSSGGGDAQLPPVLHSAPITLTSSQHDGRCVTLLPGASLTLDWAKLGNGFSCLLLNRTGAALLPSVVGFTGGSITTAAAHTRLASAGTTAMLAHSPDGGATRFAEVVGATVA